jgi:hypothetical protein
MSKLDPNIIREGDMVRVVIPEVLVRVGYPLCFEEAREQTEEKLAPAIAKLIDEIHYHACNKTERGTPSIASLKDRRVYKRILNAAAYEFLRARRFGGVKRSIYTRTAPELEGEVFPVAGVKFRKTGDYYPPSGGYGTWYDDYDDYEPGGLGNEKTHKFVDICTFSMRKMDGSDGTWIEVCHVEKIHDEEEED